MVIQTLIDFLAEAAQPSSPYHSFAGGGANLRIWKAPLERRQIFTSKYVYDRTGVYYVRIFAEDDANFAREVRPSKALFCSRTLDKKFSSPNINRINLMNEYNVVP